MIRKRTSSGAGRTSQQRRRLIIGLSAAVLAIAGLIYLTTQSGTQQAGDGAAATTQQMPELMETGSLPEKTMGPADAPVTIIEYSSATCPHCARFHQDLLPQIKEEYVDTGKVHYVMREFPLDNLAMAAFMVARCVEGDGYFAFLDVLYARQQDWAYGEGDAAERLYAIARQAGLSREKFNQCLQNEELMEGITWVYNRASQQFGVSSTPTFFVNGTMLRGPSSIEDFEELMPPDVTG